MNKFSSEGSMKVCAFSLVLLGCISSVFGQTKVTSASFGKTPEGATVEVYTLADKAVQVRVITFGAHLISVKAPDRDGKVADVVLGYETLDGYLADTKTYMGSVPGRYANRIAKGAFALDGHTYQITTNNNGNMLHGGVSGFDRLNWKGRAVPNGVEFTVVSPDGDQGFPGTMTAHVRYTLLGDKLRMDYSATTDKPTVVNLTNHTYFNLAGAGDILNQEMMIAADRLTTVDAQLIPTGELAPVSGTPLDFRKPAAIGARIHADNAQLKVGGGYDHNYVLNAPGLTHVAAKVKDPSSGRTLTVYTTEPGVQFYSGNSLDGSMKGRSGEPYGRFAGFCLETQHFPDSPNHPSFPTTTLRPGATYKTSTVFQFAAEK